MVVFKSVKKPTVKGASQAGAEARSLFADFADDAVLQSH